MLRILLPLLLTTLFNKFILKHNHSLFIVDLPTYPVPSFKT
ncbi:hypothetical protein, partial [Staphylococcus epidermidis]